MHKVDCMSHQNSGLLLKFTQDNILYDSLPYTGIQGGDWIIHQEDLFIRVDSSSKTDPCLLSSREVDSLLSDLGQIPSLKDFKVS